MLRLLPPVRDAVIIVAMTLALAAPPVAAWAAWGSGERSADDPVPAVPDPQPRAPVRTGPILYDVPGTVALREQGPLDRFARSGALEQVDADLLESGGTEHVEAFITIDGTVGRGLWRFTVRDGADPEELCEQLNVLYEEKGWRRRAPQRHGDVTTFMTPAVESPVAGQMPILRTHYVAGRDVIRVDAYDKSERNDEVTATFDGLVRRQLAHQPASNDNASHGSGRGLK